MKKYLYLTMVAIPANYLVYVLYSNLFFDPQATDF